MRLRQAKSKVEFEIMAPKLMIALFSLRSLAVQRDLLTEVMVRYDNEAEELLDMVKRLKSAADHEKSIAAVRPMSLRARNFLVRQLVHAVAGTVRGMSLQRSYRFADGLGAFAYYAYPKIRRQVLSNLNMALGGAYERAELTQIARRCVNYHSRSIVELLRIPDLSRQELLELVRLEGSEHLDSALEHGKGVILVTAHFGNWELMGARLVASGYPISVVVRDQLDSAFTRYINEIRGHSGMRIIQRGDIHKILTCLKRNHVLGILSDQNEPSGEVFVNFFGRPAAAVTGPATLARRTGAVVVPGFISRDQDNSHTIRMQPPLELVHTDDRDQDILVNTARIAKLIERQIASQPEQWLWIHRRWKRSGEFDRTKSVLAVEPTEDEDASFLEPNPNIPR